MSRRIEAKPAAESGYLWDVHEFGYPFGLGKRLGQVRAKSRADAETIAAEQFPAKILVTRAGGKPQLRPPSKVRPW